jgi:hypothetical protein
MSHDGRVHTKRFWCYGDRLGRVVPTVADRLAELMEERRLEANARKAHCVSQAYWHWRAIIRLEEWFLSRDAMCGGNI